jgi:hypothetical protein
MKMFENLQDHSTQDQLYRIHFKTDGDNGGSFMSSPLTAVELERMLDSLKLDSDVYDLKIITDE